MVSLAKRSEQLIERTDHSGEVVGAFLEEAHAEVDDLLSIFDRVLMA